MFEIFKYFDNPKMPMQKQKQIVKHSICIPGDCVVTSGSYGACFEDQSSGRMWQVGALHYRNERRQVV